MGLLDQVIGSVVGGGKSGGGGMSPLAKALLMLLAAKAASSYMGGSSGHAAQPSAPSGGAHPEPSGKVESGILAGIPSLDSLLDHFRTKGHGDKVESWIGSGPNKPIEPKEIGNALDAATLDRLERESGLPRNDLLSQLSSALPQVIDKLTPGGRLPSRDERGHW